MSTKEWRLEHFAISSPKEERFEPQILFSLH